MACLEHGAIFSTLTAVGMEGGFAITICFDFLALSSPVLRVQFSKTTSNRSSYLQGYIRKKQPRIAFILLTSLRANAQLVSDVDVSFGRNSPLALLYIGSRPFIHFPRAAAKWACNITSFGLGPHLKAFMVHVLSTGSPAPDDGLGSLSIEFGKANRAIIFHWLSVFAASSLSHRYKGFDGWSRCENGSEFGAEESKLICEGV